MVIRIVPPSFINIPSPEATAVVPLAVPPSIRLISAAVDVTFVPPISNVVTDISPAIVKRPSATVIKSVSSVCPMVVPFIRTSSISREPPDIKPVVVKFSLPKSIVPLESVILPLAKVRLPMVEPVAAVIVPVNVELSSAVIAPTRILA